MKKALMVLVAVMLMMGLATGANAALSYTVDNRTASFYLVDLDGNGTVVMHAITNGLISNLDYSYDNKTWRDFDGDTRTAEIDITSTNHTQLIYLRYLDDGVDDGVARSMTFQGGTPDGDLYTSLFIDFNGTVFTFESNSVPDALTPVPISPSVYLMGAGLLGLVGLRRRFNK